MSTKRCKDKPCVPNPILKPVAMHMGEYCVNCGCFLRWVPKDEQKSKKPEEPKVELKPVKSKKHHKRYLFCTPSTSFDSSPYYKPSNEDVPW